MKHHYITDTIGDADEHKRLELLERLYDPPTKADLRSAGLRPGQSVLEIGPGAGSLLRWIASEVGPSGKAIGVDQNPRFLKDLDLPNARVIKGDFMSIAFDDAPFDLIYVRFVLLHTPEPATMVARMFDLLKPGGKVVVVDIDYASQVACDPDHSAAEGFAESQRAIGQAMLDCGLMDVRIGRRLPELMAQAGFRETSIACASHPIQGGTDEAWIWKRNTEIMAEAGIRAGTLAKAVPSAGQPFDDPTFRFIAPMLVTAVAERSAS